MAYGYYSIHDSVKSDDLSPESRRTIRLVLRGARFGLTGGFALISATLASCFVPPSYAWLAYTLVGATMTLVYWWVWGKIFRNVGLTVD